MAILDRVLATTNFEAFYPSANIKGISRLGSDHVPLVINFGTSHERKHYLFRFEKWWLEQEDICHVIEISWNSPCYLSNPIEV